MSTSTSQTSSSVTNNPAPGPAPRNWKWIATGAFTVVAVVGTILFFTVGKSSGDSSDPTLSGTGQSTDEVQNAEWGPWGAECFQDPSDQLWKKRRTCVKEPVNGGIPCSELDGGDDTRICDPLSGNYSDFPEDSDEVCLLKRDAQGKEKWIKTRECNNPVPRNGGAGCVGNAEQECNPVNGVWSAFSECKVELDSAGKEVKDSQGRVIWNKTRTCTGSKYGGKCSGDAKVRCDPVDNVWVSPADSDALCVEEKDANGKSVWMKTRICSNTQYGGICPGDAKVPCTPVDGVWKSVPDSDTVCTSQRDDKSGGVSIYVKNKQCVGAKYGGICPGNSTEPCNSVNGQWSGGINDAPCEITTTSYAPFYPKEGLTPNSEAGKASASSTFNGEEAWKAFNDKSTYWHSNLYYDKSRNGQYAGQTKTVCYENDPAVTREVYGEWIQVELPIKILPQSFTFSPRQDGDMAFTRSPVNFVLLASNDGKSWRVIFIRIGEMWKNKMPKQFTIMPKKPLYDLYSIYRLVILSVGGSEGNSVQIGQIRIIPESPYFQTIECTPPKYGGFGCPVLASTNAIGNSIEVDPLNSNKRRSQCVRPDKRVRFNAILPSGRRLTPGDSVVNGDYTLLLEQDGNLILLQAGMQMKWQSATNGNSNCRAEMQPDGNFVIYDSNNQPLWSSGTSGNGNQLTLTDKGALSINSSIGAYIKIIYQDAFTIVNTIEKDLQINTTGTLDNLLDPRYKYFITGSWINGYVPITDARQLEDGRVVYMVFDIEHVKMVTNTGEARYFPATPDKNAKVTDFNPKAWSTYPSASTNYKLRICDILCTNGCFPEGACIVTNTLYSDKQVQLPMRSDALLSPMHQYRMVGECTPPGGVRIQTARLLPDGRLVYMIEDDGYVKMVTNTGEARFYGKEVAPTSGRISDFDPSKWTSYKDGNRCYKLSITPINCTPPIGTSTGTCPLNAKYVEIARIDSKNEYINVAEIETYGIGSKAEEVKFTYVNGETSPPFPNNQYTWQNLQDGNLDTFAHTTIDDAKNWFPFMRLEIKDGPKAVSRVVVHNRKDDCCKFRLNGCALRLRDDRGVIIWQRPFPEPEQLKYEFITEDGPLERIKMSGCEGQTLPSIVCPVGKVITYANVGYGRNTDKICKGTGVVAGKESWRTEPISNAIGKSEFSSVTLPTGDPAPGVYKHWEVIYSCDVPLATVTTAIAPPPVPKTV